MNKEQQLIMVEWMERYGDLSHVVKSPQGRLKKNQLWKQLIGILHRVAGGSIKNHRDWAKSWSELKLRTKRKSRALVGDHEGTGGGRPKATKMTEIEERVAAIIGGRGILGGPSQETGLEVQETLQAPVQTMLEASVEVEVEALEEDFSYDVQLYEDEEKSQDEDDLPMYQAISEDEEVTMRSTVMGRDQTREEPVHRGLPREDADVAMMRLAVRRGLSREDGDQPAPGRSPGPHAVEDLQGRVAPRTPPVSTVSTPENDLRSARRQRRRRVVETPYDRAAALFAQLEERRLAFDQQRLEYEMERERERQRLLNTFLDILRAWTDRECN